MKANNKKSNQNNFIDFNSKKEVGNLGEDIACLFLERKNYHIIERNYLKKWGEIDIVAVKDSILTFIEVKSVVDNGGSRGGGFRPEENVHKQKRLRLRRTIQTCMAQLGRGIDTEFLFHVVVVRMDVGRRRARVLFLENIIL
ncbi:MAG: YraN family protein [bacterium]